eukprot:m.448833 g.448833  ORF g.448833 m.448833 type:complete len:204 (-) comp56892_c1_seq19:1174-1785(-)
MSSCSAFASPFFRAVLVVTSNNAFAFESPETAALAAAAPFQVSLDCPRESQRMDRLFPSQSGRLMVHVFRSVSEPAQIVKFRCNYVVLLLASLIYCLWNSSLAWPVSLACYLYAIALHTEIAQDFRRGLNAGQSVALKKVAGLILFGSLLLLVSGAVMDLVYFVGSVGLLVVHACLVPVPALEMLSGKEFLRRIDTFIDTMTS